MTHPEPATSASDIKSPQIEHTPEQRDFAAALGKALAKKWQQERAQAISQNNADHLRQ